MFRVRCGLVCPGAELTRLIVTAGAPTARTRAHRREEKTTWRRPRPRDRSQRVTTSLKSDVMCASETVSLLPQGSLPPSPVGDISAPITLHPILRGARKDRPTGVKVGRARSNGASLSAGTGAHGTHCPRPMAHCGAQVSSRSIPTAGTT